MKVSVVILTYNHERFIAQAIDSVLCQRTKFPYEVIVSEDHSTDRTLEIARSYQEMHPSIVRVVAADRNHGYMNGEVYEQAFSVTKGEYIAILDGDDYWTSTEKLQRQVKFLDRHRQFSGCFHNVLVTYEDGSRKDEYFHPPAWTPRRLSLTDVIQWWQIPLCSLMFRRHVVSPLPGWFFDVLYKDWALHLLCARHGDIGYHRRPMAVYRKHDTGYTSILDPVVHREETLLWYEDVNRITNYQFRNTILSSTLHFHRELMTLYKSRGQTRKAWGHFWRYVYRMAFFEDRSFRKAFQTARLLIGH